MKRAGFETVWTPPECGNQRVLQQIIGERLNLEDIINPVSLIRKAGLGAAAALVIGILGETWSDTKDTAEFARKLKQKGANQF